ncbi:hypothetical protein BKI52_10990 [marine bacterium AO1-C]|nr:hypothetical protein BKI52_10990 [marine bacterium AO1-C]
MKETKIELNKGNLLTLSVLAIVMALVAIFFIILTLQERDKTIYFIINLGLGSIGVLFFGGGALFLLQKYQDKEPGLIINEKGIFDNSSFISLGFIAWADMDTITELTVKGQHFIRVKMKNPKKYTQKTKAPLKRMFLVLNSRFYGSPIQISANSLKARHQVVFQLIQSGLDEYRSLQPS